jgi:hypothetical protein
MLRLHALHIVCPPGGATEVEAHGYTDSGYIFMQFSLYFRHFLEYFAVFGIILFIFQFSTQICFIFVNFSNLKLKNYVKYDMPPTTLRINFGGAPW